MNGGGTTDVAVEQRVQIGQKGGVRPSLEIRRFKLGDRRDQRLGHETSAVGPEVTAGVRVTPPKAGALGRLRGVARHV